MGTKVLHYRCKMAALRLLRPRRYTLKLTQTRPDTSPRAKYFYLAPREYNSSAAEAYRAEVYTSVDRSFNIAELLVPPLCIKGMPTSHTLGIARRARFLSNSPVLYNPCLHAVRSNFHTFRQEFECANRNAAFFNHCNSEDGKCELYDV